MTDSQPPKPPKGGLKDAQFLIAGMEKNNGFLKFLAPLWGVGVHFR